MNGLFGQFLVGQAYQKENQKAIKFNDFYLSIYHYASYSQLCDKLKVKKNNVNTTHRQCLRM